MDKDKNIITNIEPAHDVMAITISSEPRREKSCLRGFQPASTQTGLYNHRRWIEALDLLLSDCTIYVAKTKALICVFVFAYAKLRFCHDAVQLQKTTTVT